MRLFAILIIALFPLASHALSARVITDVGTIMIELHQDRAPKTVDNFVGLAKGDIKFTQTDGKKVTRPFYDGLSFYRVNPDLGIFTGDPWGNGRGWPGYFIDEEVQPDNHFDKPGLVAMAKIRGEKRYGSQFFITTKALPFLDGQYTIFGNVTVGMEVVMKIAHAPHNAREIPTTPVKIKNIEIVQ